eukprot:scaffold94596_cov57-Phaeocystis_antarctica.AAC.1
MQQRLVAAPTMASTRSQASLSCFFVPKEAEVLWPAAAGGSPYPCACPVPRQTRMTMSLGLSMYTNHPGDHTRQGRGWRGRSLDVGVLYQRTERNIHAWKKRRKRLEGVWCLHTGGPPEN